MDQMGGSIDFTVRKTFDFKERHTQVKNYLMNFEPVLKAFMSKN